MRHAVVKRTRARALRAEGVKMEAISVELDVPRSTIRDWTLDMSRRRPPTVKWCPPQWRSYNKHLSWYWKIPLRTRQVIIATIAGRPTTKRERYVIMKSFTRGEPR